MTEMLRPVVLALCLMTIAGCAGGRVTHPPVPRALDEQVPAPPRSAAVQIWQPGHYDWDGRDYVWVPGEWVDRGSHSALWQDGYWRETAAAPVWVPAHWL